MKIKGNFKILTYQGIVVNETLLSNGIYEDEIPKLYRLETTIESILEFGERLKDISGADFYSENFIKNIRECEFIEIEINQK